MLTLCANELQARLLRADYNQAQWEAGAAAWEAPAILSFERWARQFWLDLWPQEELISRSKERWLWLQIIAAEPRANLVLAPRQLAQQLMHCWRLCQHWRIDPQAAPQWTPEQELYAVLHGKMSHELAKRHWLSDSQILGAIEPHLEQAAGLAIQLAPGDWHSQASPLQTQILERLGCALPAPPPARPSLVKGWLCKDSAQQWQAVAQQLREQLSHNPHSRLVVGVNNLAAHRAQLEDCFKAELCPASDSLQAMATEQEYPWQIELPRALPEWPMARALLDLLQLMHLPLGFAELSAVLRQPLFYEPQEWLFCVAAETRLRERGLRFSVQDLSNALPSQAPEALKQRCKTLGELIRQLPQRASATQWADHFQSLWAAFPLHPDAAVWRLREDLSQALAVFQSLSDELGPLSRRQATHWLHEVLDDHYHSPHTQQRCPIVVCELETACSLPAAQTYLCAVDGASWPPALPSLPWLNPELLRAAQHPLHSGAQWFAQQHAHWQCTLAQPQQLELYACRQDSSGQEVQPSPWLRADWQELNAAPAPQPAPTAYIAETGIPELSSDRLLQQKRAVSMLRRMARSPFAAFVQDRLAAQPLPAVPQGLGADRQGQWIHALLDRAWAELRSSRQLAQTSDEALHGLLQELCTESAEEFLPQQRFGPFLRHLETDRVLRLCLGWLQHERRRKDPFEVIHRELDIAEVRAMLPLAMRIDRIDRVLVANSPRLLIVDYKTGQADHSGWSSEGLHEPQLPLYATSQALVDRGLHPIDGICFARVHHRQMALVAATNWCQRLIEDGAERAWPGRWEEELKAWESRLLQLIGDYRHGEIRHALNYALEQDWSLRELAFLLNDYDAQEVLDGLG